MSPEGHSSCEKYTGLCALIARWKDKDTDELLVPVFRSLIEGDSRWRWNSRESCFELAVIGKLTSRVYPRGLKPSENAAPFSNFAGLTIGLGYVAQLEEVDRDIFQTPVRPRRPWMKRRLSGWLGGYSSSRISTVRLFRLFALSYSVNRKYR